MYVYQLNLYSQYFICTSNLMLALSVYKWLTTTLFYPNILPKLTYDLGLDDWRQKQQNHLISQWAFFIYGNSIKERLNAVK